jgi:hypothetical protein
MGDAICDDLPWKLSTPLAGDCEPTLFASPGLSPVFDSGYASVIKSYYDRLSSG